MVLNMRDLIILGPDVVHLISGNSCTVSTKIPMSILKIVIRSSILMAAHVVALSVSSHKVHCEEPQAECRPPRLYPTQWSTSGFVS